MKKLFIYFLSISFLLTVSGFHGAIAETKIMSLPIGEMISKGKVQFEVRPNQWREIEKSYFPIFEGMKIRTERGMSKIAFLKGDQVEIQPNSMVIIEHNNKLTLKKGGVEFRIPSSSDLMLSVGNILILKPKILQASTISLPVTKTNEEIIGSLTLHSNGALTIKSEQGSLTVIDDNKRVLASLRSRDSITLPSNTFNFQDKTVVAQAGDVGTTVTGGEFLGLSTWTWIGIAAAVAVIGGVAIAAGGGGDHDRVPICP